jgi:1-acylglycerone phosphate reductase
MTPLLDMDLGKACKLFDVNVFAPISVVKAFIPLLIANKGTIINIGSYVDTLPVPWQGVYNASKAALRSLTDNLRLELRPFNVDVVYVRPFPFSSSFLLLFFVTRM